VVRLWRVLVSILVKLLIIIYYLIRYGLRNTLIVKILNLNISKISSY
jgi:hypothetical protein